jgi:hypothetical protein
MGAILRRRVSALCELVPLFAGDNNWPTQPATSRRYTDCAVSVDGSALAHNDNVRRLGGSGVVAVEMSVRACW